MKTDHPGDLFHRLGFCCGCSELKRYLGNSGVVFIANWNIISFIYNAAAQAVCKQTCRECKTPTAVYTYLKGEGGEKEREKGWKEKKKKTTPTRMTLTQRITDDRFPTMTTHKVDTKQVGSLTVNHPVATINWLFLSGSYSLDWCFLSEHNTERCGVSLTQKTHIMLAASSPQL